MDKLEHIISNSVIVSNPNIEEIYDSCVGWLRKKRIKLIESSKPYNITASARNLFLETKSIYADNWIMEIQFFQNRKGIEVIISLADVITFRGRHTSVIPYYYPFVVRSFYENLGITMTKGILRPIFPKNFIHNNIGKISRYSLFYFFILILMMIYGYSTNNLLMFMILGTAPVAVLIENFEKITVLNSLKKRLYFDL